LIQLNHIMIHLRRICNMPGAPGAMARGARPVARETNGEMGYA
jgi:hypothetical protein